MCVCGCVESIMNNAPAILKSLVIYAVCVPLAVIIGFIVTDPVSFFNVCV